MTRKIDFVDIYDFLLNNEVTEPVEITKHGQPHAVIIPYESFMAARSKRKARMAHELSAEDLKSIMDSEIPEDLAQYDSEVEK
jgi:prevent-host-death family protein